MPGPYSHGAAVFSPLPSLDADGQAADVLHVRLEQAAHIAHTAACQLRLLAATCPARAGASLHLCTEAFSAAMRELSECVRSRSRGHRTSRPPLKAGS